MDATFILSDFIHIYFHSGLYNAKAILVEEQQWYYLMFLCLMAYQPFMGYIMPKPSL